MKIENFTKYYGDKKIYENFNLEIEDGSVLALLGKSGSGKTTLLNALAGITDYEGKITGANEVSFVFQTDRLIPNLTVEENLKLICPEKDSESALKSVGMEKDGKLYPKELSGGMARRVALLRAFLYGGSLMLLDEPFRNLDISLKIKLGQMFKDLRQNNKNTCILVTHDIDEAVDLADRIIVIDGGKIVFDSPSVTENKEGLKERIKEVLIQ